jgi:hydrogenase expression/formation protein HypD
MDRDRIRQLADKIARQCDGWTIQLMEVCGTHTVSLFRTGIKALLPDSLRLVSGPGCPVCVTSQGYLDVACELARRPDVTVCTYGDMLRVPGRDGSLEDVRATGGRVAVVYSARDALATARDNPGRQVVFLAVGFETTAPASAATVLAADRAGIDNFTILPGHKLVIPAMNHLIADPDLPIDGFLCPGHVSVILGTQAFEPIARDHHKPCVVAGFEPDGMLQAICELTAQVAAGEARVANAYGAAVGEQGNPAARELIDTVFAPAPAVWRAMGELTDSGLDLRGPYRRFDAFERFDVAPGPDVTPPGCRCGEVIQGKALPADCPLFGAGCSPTEPVGPCMVSSEGTCAAWYKYGPRRRRKADQ